MTAGAEIKQQRTRIAVLEHLLEEGLRNGYFDHPSCSPSWLAEVRKAIQLTL